jgi:hypothetical protein
VGEGIEVVKKDYAEEVKEMAKGGRKKMNRQQSNRATRNRQQAMKRLHRCHCLLPVACCLLPVACSSRIVVRGG